jgi:hypothetical protein
MYDYQLGRFLNVDPVIQFPTNTQSLNPYSYILNNPLAGADPTGYTSVDTRSICFHSPGSCGQVLRTDSVAALHMVNGVGSEVQNNGAKNQSSVQVLRYIDPSSIADPKQRDALVETQNRADLFFNGDYENPNVLEPLVEVGIINTDDSFIMTPRGGFYPVCTDGWVKSLKA